MKDQTHMYIIKIVATLLILMIEIILFSFVSFALPQEYLNEFNLANQKCEIKDTFYYINNDGNFATATLYFCCNDKMICDEILFDVLNEKEFNKQDLIELYNTIYVKSLIDENKISPEIFELEASKGICEYFGFDVLASESLNLITENEKYIHKYISPRTKGYVHLAKKYGKAFGMVKEFNPGVFVASIACTGFIKDEEKILYNLAECKQYFELINTNNAYFGLNQKMSFCIYNIKLELKKYVDSPLMQLKEPFDIITNIITGFFSWLSKGPITDQENKLEIKEPNYQLFKKIYQNIVGFNENLEDVNSDSKSEQVIKNLRDRREPILNEYDDLMLKFRNIKNSRPAPLMVLIKNMLLEPNYNLSQTDLYISQANEKLQKMDYFIIKDKFNSASSLKSDIDADLKNADALLRKELNLKRKIFGLI